MYGRFFDMTKPKELPSIELLNEFFEFDTENGILYWKYRDIKWFKTPRHYKMWNTRYANKEVLNANHNYKRVRILLKDYMYHRIIFKMYYGYDPDTIDHINGNEHDNRIINLRSVSPHDNRKNTAKYFTNKSGVIGVFYSSKDNRWIASIKANKNKRLYKSFKTFEEAVACRKAWEKEFGYHENHGRERNVA